MMQKLIPLINKLQDAFHSVGMLESLDLPQITVVGSQSSGKSSVLENLVGRDFLPRGTGIVTRRPLVLQLIHDKDPKGVEVGEFLHQQGKKYTNFAEIRQEIVKETDRVTGKDKGISELPIHLKITSPHVLNLTLVDLPGITKNPVGDQPKDIEYVIKKMILQYISRPNCIILAVTSANTDIANSDALKLAREVDRAGNRTLGVLTKLDLMDEGTNALDIFRGRVIPLKLGYIGVINRGQKDIENNKPISKAVSDEKAFFENHPAYSSMANKLGTPYLAKRLNNLLLIHIKKTLPDIKAKIHQLMTKAQARLAEYGIPLAETEMSKGALLLQLLTQFSMEFTDIIDGKNINLNTHELFGGARINHIFTQKYVPHLMEMEACDGLTEQDIRNAIRNAKGPRTALFIPESSFEMLVKTQVKKLEDPSITCVDQVMEELSGIIDHCEKHLVRFPTLQEKVREFVFTLFKRYSAPLKVFIKNLINIELAYVNTNHPDFFGGGQDAYRLMEQVGKPKKSPQQQFPQQDTVDHHPLHRRSSQGSKPVIPRPKSNNQTVYDDDDWFKVPSPKDKASKPSSNQKFFPNIFSREKKQAPPSNDHRNHIEPITNNLQVVDDSYNYDPPQQQQYEPAPIRDRETMETEIIKNLLREYFQIVRKNICDSVPKAIMHFLVNMTKLHLQSELVGNCYRSELFDDLLQENDEIAQKRKATTKMFNILQKANTIVSEFPSQIDQTSTERW